MTAIASAMAASRGTRRILRVPRDNVAFGIVRRPAPARTSPAPRSRTRAATPDRRGACRGDRGGVLARPSSSVRQLRRPAVRHREPARARRPRLADGVALGVHDRARRNWHPLTWLSHMLDVELFGARRRRASRRRTSLLHALATLLLFAVLRAHDRGRVGASACVAALFALHPLHVESVAWVAERKDVLSALFCHAHDLRATSPGRRAAGVGALRRRRRLSSRSA